MADTFDYVIVGAGPAGCVLANRLTEADMNTVCVLEAGGKDSSPYIRLPAGFVKTLYSGDLAWRFQSEPGPVVNRPVALPQGKVLGGSSSINGMVFNRGQRLDFDTWAQFGNPGWGYDDLLPYFKRCEQRVGAHDSYFRGTDGELPVTDPDWINPLCEAFLAATEAEGIPRNPDYNGARQYGAGYYQRFIHRGRRVSAADAFLRPALRRAGIELRMKCQAVAVTFDGRRAVGVRYRDGDGTERVVKARHEVIVSAGTVNSAKLLQLSGIGPPDALQALGIPLQAARDGVGENLQDHYSLRLVARAKNVLTINEYGRWPRLPLEFAKWCLRKPSVLSNSPSVIYVHGKSHPGVADCDLRILFTPGSYKEGQTYVLDDYPGMTCGAAQPRPESTGYVRIRSTEPDDYPVVQPNYLQAEADRTIMLAGVRLVRRIFNNPALAHYFDHETLPGAHVQTDDELLDFARQKGNTGYHLVGTCRMGPTNDPRSVVDPELRVIGVESLRVVDASIMPRLPSANTFASTIAVAEKAADMIRGRPPLPAARAPA